MKRIISLILSLSLIFSTITVINAGETNKQTNLYALASEIMEDIPGSEVYVSNGSLHIVVSSSTELPLYQSEHNAQLRTTSVISSNGGSFRNYVLPWYAYSSNVPYFQSYMNRDAVTSLLIVIGRPDIVSVIHDALINGLSTAAISTLVSSQFSVNLSSVVIGVIISLMQYSYNNLEYRALSSAHDSSTTGKVSVTKVVTPDGINTFYYMPWNDNTCTTYMNYDATWYEGDYGFELMQ